VSGRVHCTPARLYLASSKHVSQHNLANPLLGPCLGTRLAGGMELTLSGPGIKLFGKAIHSLCKVGACVETLTWRTESLACSARRAPRVARWHRALQHVRSSLPALQARRCWWRLSQATRCVRRDSAAPCAAATLPHLPRPPSWLTHVLTRARRPPVQLTLRAINQSHSAYFAVRLRVDCFETFRVRDMVQTAIYAKVRAACALRRGVVARTAFCGR